MSVTCPGTAFTNVDFPLVSTGDLYAAASLQRFLKILQYIYYLKCSTMLSLKKNLCIKQVWVELL